MAYKDHQQERSDPRWDESRNRFDQRNKKYMDYRDEWTGGSDYDRGRRAYRYEHPEFGDYRTAGYDGDRYREDYGHMEGRRRQSRPQWQERYGRDFQGSGYRSYDQVGRRSDQPESIYGGDTRNYGNANQGGFDPDWWDRARAKVSSWLGAEDAERGLRPDEHRTGINRGKGPKGYQRSVDRIREDICDRLTDDDRVDATDIDVRVQGDEVILSGTVHSREEKRRAEDLVESVPGVHNVENRIHIDHGNRL